MKILLAVVVFLLLIFLLTILDYYTKKFLEEIAIWIVNNKKK